MKNIDHKFFRNFIRLLIRYVACHGDVVFSKLSWVIVIESFICFSFVVTTISLASATELKTRLSQICTETDKDGTCLLHEVSIVELIANPEVFNGKKVRLVGYMNLQFEGNALYLHAEDYKHGLSRNGLWLQVPKGWPDNAKKCPSKSYVLLEATFNATNTGHFGLYSGGLETITRCTRWR